MTRLFVRGLIVALSILLACFSEKAQAKSSLVCREPSIEGMSVRIDNIHSWLGENVTDPSRIRVYITQEDGKLYIQSNFRSRNVNTGQLSENPTKILIEPAQMKDLNSAFVNIIYWADSLGDLPLDYEAQAAAAVRSAEIYVDPSILGTDGRMPFDISGAQDIKLSSDRFSIESGKIEVLQLNDPPPALIERISGCCLNGRPPGGSHEIMRRLSQQSIVKDRTSLFSMVIDSGTDSVIRESDVLRDAAARVEAGTDDWSTRLQTAMQQSRGKTLIVLSHVEKGRVVVEDAAQEALYSISLDDIHAMARRNGVNLILFGCETARSASSYHLPVGIIGKYNTAFAARRAAAALESSSNGAEFLSAMATEKLNIVVQAGAWSDTGAGASLYKPRRLGRAIRLFRVWFMGGR